MQVLPTEYLHSLFIFNTIFQNLKNLKKKLPFGLA